MVSFLLEGVRKLLEENKHLKTELNQLNYENQQLREIVVQKEVNCRKGSNDTNDIYRTSTVSIIDDKVIFTLFVLISLTFSLFFLLCLIIFQC